MKKTLIFSILLVVAAPLMANDVKILKEARDSYYKSQNAPTNDVVVVEEIVVDDDYEDLIEPGKMSKLERLEATAALAADKVDFYQRVVRSVAREEKELGEYASVIRQTVKKPARKTTTKRTNKK